MKNKNLFVFCVIGLILMCLTMFFVKNPIIHDRLFGVGIGLFLPYCITETLRLITSFRNKKIEYSITKDDIFIGKKLYKYKNDIPKNRTECYVSNMDMFPIVRVNDKADFTGFSNIVDINSLCLNKNIRFTSEL